MLTMTTLAASTPTLDKLCDLFANVIETVITDQALQGAPCHDLSHSQWEGALFIQRHDDCSIRELAEGLGVSHPAAVKLVERLHRKELITRTERDPDHRVVHLQLSEAGVDCVNHVREQRTEVLETIVRRMSSGDQDGFASGLRSFMAAALQDDNTAEAVCLHCGTEHVEQCLVHGSHV
jgi:DNA-binding MarR family transcriptional regulator